MTGTLQGTVSVLSINGGNFHRWGSGCIAPYPQSTGQVGILQSLQALCRGLHNFRPFQSAENQTESPPHGHCCLMSHIMGQTNCTQWKTTGILACSRKAKIFRLTSFRHPRHTFMSDWYLIEFHHRILTFWAAESFQSVVQINSVLTHAIIYVLIHHIIYLAGIYFFMPGWLVPCVIKSIRSCCKAFNQ